MNMKLLDVNLCRLGLISCFSMLLFFMMGTASAVTRNATSITDLQAKINISGSGDIIILADGTYLNNTFNVSENGITVKAATPGGVFLNGTNDITISGSNVSFSGFQFTSGTITGNVITVTGDNNTLTQLNFNGYSAQKMIVLDAAGQNNTISYCNFENKPDGAAIGNLIHIDPNASVPGYHKIRYCSFQNMPGAGGDNGNECIRISNGATSTYVSRTIVEYNYFTNTGAGDAEVISVKCRENVLRYNTMVDNQQANFCFRNGDNNIAYGNFFKNSGGIRVKEANNIYCYNNYFENCGDGSITAPVKYVFVSPNLNNINFIHNTFVDGTPIELDTATNNTWANNIFKKTSGNIFSGPTSGKTFVGNIYSGTLGVTIPSGMTNTNPQLVINSDGYYALSASSPVNNANASYPAILDIAVIDDDPTLAFDISGQARPATVTSKDVGADEYTTGTTTNHPLALSEVGPSFLGGPGSKLNQTITFNALSSKMVGDVDFSAGASASSSLTVSLASSNESVATIVSGNIHIVGVGTTTITASQAGNGTYNPAVDVLQTLNVSKGNQTITFNALPSKMVGDADFSAGASASSGLAVSLASSNEAVATIISGNIHIVGVGTTTIAASQPGDLNYNVATNVTQTLTVSGLTHTITFVLPLKYTNSADFVPGAVSSIGSPITYSSSNPAVATIVDNKIHIVAKGTSNITASAVGNGSYGAATNEQQLIVQCSCVQ
ncbi:chondroitinase-B domain-containing protein [Flavobacterium sp.]|uniref:chondroitinase-B domain-containing protein n=1 Tax=Flavobacterium sp. TaxID=239 RepID=UPI0037BE4357